METLKLKNLSFSARCGVIAQVLHAANRAYTEVIGGMAHNPTWEELSAQEKSNLIEAVKSTIENPRTPEQSHEAWMNSKLEQGWKYGPHKNPIKKTHPDLIPFRDLPFEEKIKDALYLGITSIFVSALGMVVMPPEFVGEPNSEDSIQDPRYPATSDEGYTPRIPTKEEIEADLVNHGDMSLQDGIICRRIIAYAMPTTPFEYVENLTDTEKANTGNNDTLEAASAAAEETAPAPPEIVEDKSSTEAEAAIEDGNKDETAKASRKKSKPKGSK